MQHEKSPCKNKDFRSRGTRIRTRTSGFGDRYSTIKLYPYIKLYEVPSKLHIKFTHSPSQNHIPCTGIFSSLRSENDLRTMLVASLRSLLAKVSGQALDRLVTVSYRHYCPSTSALSTSSSSRGLTSFEWEVSS